MDLFNPPGTSKTYVDGEDAKRVSKSGDTMAGQLVIADPVQHSKIIAAMYNDGNYNGHQDAPTNLDIGSIYIQLGGTEYGAGSYRLVGAGFRQSDSNHAPVVFGYQEASRSGHTSGDFLVATRNVTTDTAPTTQFRVRANGQVELENAAYAPASGKSVVNKTYVDAQVAPKLTATQGAAQADSTATDVAGLVADFNALLAKLRTAGIIAT
ncbi:Head fiber protein [Paenibacillus algorifonticola]|uniref:Head fiber protein n=1 Tax=Paenibacillus algorifonticola TaxID=684063 RepID=A0A1I2ALE3_9BACL|nr:head fiber protein [Paenibacillus algorifonticola]SFE43690.1 Head fiber protein [Paenibacillus algorifonticola]